MTCKDCIHNDVCDGFTPTDLDRDIFDYVREGRSDEIPDIEERCSGFKDRNRYIELPCKVGDTAAVRALCECVITEPCYEECRNICPFENVCECEECDSANERIFDTKVSAIYDNGNGWQIEFEHIIIQARFDDIGTSFFVGENAHEQAVAYNKALAERKRNEKEKV